MTDDEFDADDGECGPCARGGGLLLLGLGLALAWMGGDLLTGGAFTRTLFGAARIGAGVPPADNGEPATDGAEGASGGGDPA